MNLHEFQEAWNKDDGGEGHISINLEPLKNAHQPLESIRKNMKNELYLQSFAIGILAFAPPYFGISGKLLMAYFTLYGLMVAMAGYYFYKFFLFFKKMHDYTANAKDSLYELYYEIRLNIEMYKSLTYLLFPMALMIGGMISYSGRNNGIQQEPILQDENDWLLLLIIAITTTLLIIGITNLWVNYYYGKHAKKIRGILDELKE